VESCIFCKIVNKSAPSRIIFKDKLVLAFVPKKVVSKGHTIIIPKLHFENIFDVDEKLFEHLAIVIKDLSKKLVEENSATGINILNASGKDAQQSVAHLHFHLIPRYPNDGLDLWIKQKL
jgi:histidine triad (HIT) family protein